VNKRRVTLNIDEDVIAALELRGGRSLSAAANETLRGALAAEAHRAALIAWLDELDGLHGSPSVDQLEAADRVLDEAIPLSTGVTSAA
jgi:plasmid stability protein